MTFLNAVMLAGMASVAIPVLIHLLNRSRFQVIRWGAMHLLAPALRQNSRRVKLEQLILLLLRCAIPCLLALLMARPVLTGLEPLLGGAPGATAFVVDMSYSMEAGAPGATPSREAAEAARRILEGMGPGSEAAVVPTGGGGVGPTHDLRAAMRGLEEAPRGQGPASPAEALAAAAGLVARMTQPYREVVVLSDFQRLSWGDAEAAARARAAEALRKGQFPARVVLFDVGRPVRDNVSVQSLEVSPAVAAKGQTLRLRSVVRNHGETAWPDLRVTLRVDGREKDAARVSIGPLQETQVLFTHAFELPGSHVVEVAADADALRADNALAAAVDVRERLSVLVVNGDPRPERLRGETDYLELALRPLGSSRTELTDFLETRVVPAGSLAEPLLRDARVAVLANVARLDAAQVEALDRFVREGGGLVVFPGDRVDADWYNTALQGLLPASLRGVAGDPRPTAQAVSLAPQRFEHPALALFNDPRNGDLSGVRVRAWLRLEERAHVLGRLESRDPFLVEKVHGRGRVVQCAVPCDADWSNLPLRSVFVPLLQQLVVYLATAMEAPRNVRAGEPLELAFPRSFGGKAVRVKGPDGRSREVAVGAAADGARLRFAETHRPGVYEVDGPEGKPVHFVVLADRKESDVSRLEDAELERLAGEMGAVRVRSVEEYRDQERERRYGQELWPVLVALVLVLLILELVLEEVFAGKGAAR